jgi:hypothetical protein
MRAGAARLSCPSDRSHRACDCVPEDVCEVASNRHGPEYGAGLRGRNGRAVGSEREQEAHTRKDVNPLIDGHDSRRRMRGSIGSTVIERGGVQQQGAATFG